MNRARSAKSTDNFNYACIIPADREFIDSLAFAGRRLADQSMRNGSDPEMAVKDITNFGLPTRLWGPVGVGAPLKTKKTKTV